MISLPIDKTSQLQIIPPSKMLDDECAFITILRQARLERPLIIFDEDQRE